ncbi:MAG: putative quinol monooxygenase [Methanobacterium sp.]
MNGVLVMYKIKDFKKWKLNNENGAGTRKSKGSRDAYVYNKKNNPNELVVLYNWDDLDNARKYFESEEFKNQMEEAGLNSDPEIQYLEEKERLMG